MYQLPMFLGISYPHWLVILSCCISFYGPFAYIRSMIYGTTKPNLVSRFFWGAVPLIGLGAALSLNADMRASARIFVSSIMPLLIFCTALCYKSSYWKLTTFDYMCGILACIALIFWLGAKEPLIALRLAIVADSCASLPTIIKARKYPETELGRTYVIGIIGALLIVPSIPKWDVINAGFQIYLFVANVVILFSIYRKKFFSHS